MEAANDPSPQPMVMITIEVPLKDLDLDECRVTRYSERTEAWGTIADHYEYDIDTDLISWNGYRVEEISDHYRTMVEDRLIEEYEA